MKETIKELGNLCKLASELEHKWDRCGRGFLETQISSAEYLRTLEEYLTAVRRLEGALTHHLVAVTAEAARDRNASKDDLDEQDHLNPAS